MSFETFQVFAAVFFRNFFFSPFQLCLTLRYAPLWHMFHFAISFFPEMTSHLFITSIIIPYRHQYFLQKHLFNDVTGIYQSITRHWYFLQQSSHMIFILPCFLFNVFLLVQ
jgi:hypothetical protein